MKLLISTPIYSDLVMAIICWNLQLKVWMESFLRAKRQKLQSKSDDRYWLALPCINLKPFCYVWWGVCNFPPKKCPKHWQNFKWRRMIFHLEMYRVLPKKCPQKSNSSYVQNISISNFSTRTSLVLQTTCQHTCKTS